MPTSALHTAIDERNLDLVKDLVENQTIDINEIDSEKNYTPLMHALLQGDGASYHIMLYLTKKGAQLNCENYFSGILKAPDINSGEYTYTLDEIEWYIGDIFKDGSMLNDELFASWSKHILAICRYLLTDYAGNIAKVQHDTLCMILIGAINAYSGHPLKFLLEQKIGVDYFQSNDEKNVLFLLSDIIDKQDDVKLLKLFKSTYKISLSQPESSANALHIVAGCYYVSDLELRCINPEQSVEKTQELISYLISQNVDINQQMKAIERPLYNILAGLTPLHIAISVFDKWFYTEEEEKKEKEYKKQYAIIELLIKYKADVNIQDNNGNTPLHFAFSNIAHDYTGDDNLIVMKANIIVSLIKAGADLQIKNINNQYPYEMMFTDYVNVGFMQQLIKQADILTQAVSSKSEFKWKILLVSLLKQFHNSYRGEFTGYHDNKKAKEEWQKKTANLLLSWLQSPLADKEDRTLILKSAFFVTKNYNSRYLLNLLLKTNHYLIEIGIVYHKEFIKKILLGVIDMSGYQVVLTNSKLKELKRLSINEALGEQLQTLISLYSDNSPFNLFSDEVRDKLVELLPTEETFLAVQESKLKSYPATSNDLESVAILIENISKLNAGFLDKLKLDTSNQLEIVPYSVTVEKSVPQQANPKKRKGTLEYFWSKSDKVKMSAEHPDEPAAKRPRFS